MAVYIYDGTFEGLLAAAALALERGDVADDISRVAPPQGALFHRVVTVETGHGRPAELFDAVAPSISGHARRDAFHAFLSEAPGIEMVVYRYLLLGRDAGESIDRMLTHDLVLPVRKLAQKVRSEAHRMKGFVRFMQVREGFYYARLEPDHNILPLIAPHFTDRFSDQDWIIHDTRRGRAIIHDSSRKKWVPVEMDLLGNPDFSVEEKFFRDLWKKYFAKIAVEERLDPKLQRQNLPLKYRRNLVEIEE